jgi:dihydrofolate reductase
MITLIAAVSSNGVIGQDNQLPWKLPFDLKWFKLHTQDSAIILGRKTYESIGWKPLPNRLNIVLSRSKKTRPEQENVIWCNDIHEAINIAGGINCFVIGGGEIFRQALLCKYIDRIIITHINVEIEGDNCTKLSLPAYGLKSIYKSKVLKKNGLHFYFEISIVIKQTIKF